MSGDVKMSNPLLAPRAPACIRRDPPRASSGRRSMTCFPPPMRRSSSGQRCRREPTTTRCRRCWTPLERLGRAWGAVAHLNAVADSPELRAAYNANLGRVTDFYTGLAPMNGCMPEYKAVAVSAMRASAPRRRARSAMPSATSCCRAQNCRAGARGAFSSPSRRAWPSWPDSGCADATDGYQPPGQSWPAC